MKKFLLMAAVVLMGAMSVNAQYKPDKMTLATELNYTGSNVKLPTYGARARLFLNENMVVRLGLGFNTGTDKKTTYNITANPETETYETTTTTNFSLLPGFEYHFSKFERVSPYVGAELGLAFGSEVTKTDNNDNDNYTRTKSPKFGFKVGAVTGVDVHIYKGFYIGAELGLGYELYNIGRGEKKSKVENTEVIVDGEKSTATNSFGLYATPALRIGWFF